MFVKWLYGAQNEVVAKYKVEFPDQLFDSY